MRVLVLGAGKMTEAILTGLQKSEDLSSWVIYSPSGVSSGNLARKVGATATASLDGVKDPDWILVGCKPQQLSDLSSILNGRFKNTLFVSMLAALGEEDQRNILGIKNLIRIMPNLPVENNVGITLLSSASSQTELPKFQKLFEKLGLSLVMSEDELDELTLLTGSGPAFYYEFTKNLAASFTSLNEEDRERLARGVLQGAAHAASESPKTLSQMTDAVTSKGGVTIAVLEAWRGAAFPEFIQKGILAGKKRTEELRSLLRK